MKFNKDKCISIIIIAMMMCPILLSLVDMSSSPIDDIEEPIIEETWPQSSNGNDFEANEFNLKTEWTQSFGTMDGVELPYDRIIKSLIGDYDGDGNDDFIFTDGRHLWVVDVDGTVIYYGAILYEGAYFFVDMAIGNLSASPGIEIVIVGTNAYFTGTNFFTIYSYPSIDIVTVDGYFNQLVVDDIDPNNPYDEIITTNYTAVDAPSTIYVYNATGDLLWQFNDTIYNTQPSIYGIDVGHDLDGDGEDDDLLAYSAVNSAFRNLTLYAINGTGDIIYTWSVGPDTNESFAGYYAIGNFNDTIGPNDPDEVCFGIANLNLTLMINNPGDPNINGTIGWGYMATHPYESLDVGDKLIDGSGEREDLIFGYTSGSNYKIEIRNGTNGNIKNWSKTIQDVFSGIGDYVVEISVGDLDNDGQDDIIICDDYGYISVYEAKVLRWKEFFGSEVTIVDNHDLIGDLNKEIIIHPFGHLMVLHENGTKILDFGSSEVLKLLMTNLDSDSNEEIIGIFKDNRIIGIDDNGTKLWEYLPTVPFLAFLPNYLINDMAFMDKDNDGITDYIYFASGQINRPYDYILDLTTLQPSLLDKDLISVSTVAVGDFDMDNFKDDFVVGGYGLKAFTYTLSGPATLWEVSSVVGSDINYFFDIAIGEFNGDGHDDVVSTFWSPTNTNLSLIAYDGLTGEKIFQYDDLNNTRGKIKVADLDGDNIDEVIVGYDYFTMDGTLTVVKKSGSTGQMMWNRTFNGVVRDIEVGYFTNDTDLDIAALAYPSEFRIYNASNGNLLGENDTNLSNNFHINLVTGNINNEDNDLEIITGVTGNNYYSVEVHTFNYSQALFPQIFNDVVYHTFQEGYINYIESGNLTGGPRDNIIFGTKKGIISCLTPFEIEELKHYDIQVLVQNNTCIAGEYLEVNFKVEIDEPDAVKKIDMQLLEWGTGNNAGMYLFEDDLIDLRLEPGISMIKASFLVPIQLKGKYFLTGTITLDNFTSNEFFEDGTQESFISKPFDILGKSFYTYIDNVEIENRNIYYLQEVELNITLKNTQTIDDVVDLNIYACVDNRAINQTTESININAGATLILERSIYIPFEPLTDMIAFNGMIYVSIDGTQGMDSHITIMGLSDINGLDVGYYLNNVSIYNSSDQEILNIPKNNLLNAPILQINRSASQFIENFSLELSLYNDYNYMIAVGAIMLTSDLTETPTLYSNDTGSPMVQINYGSNFFEHDPKTEEKFSLNISFAQTQDAGLHTMFLVVLAINIHTIRFEAVTFFMQYNLTGELNNTFYFTDDQYISDAIVQTGQNITAVTNINFTSTPVAGSNLTAGISLTDVYNESITYNVTKVYAIGDLTNLTINMTINTTMFDNCLVGLAFGVLNENYSGIIVPWRTAAIQNTVIYVITPEQEENFQADTNKQIELDLKYGNATIEANFTKDITLLVNSFDAFTNPTTSYISDLGSEHLETIGFWKITPNITVTDNDLNDNITITIEYLPESVFGQRILEQNLDLFHFNKTSGAWELVTNAVLNTATNTLTATISHLSDFAIGGQIVYDEPIFEITSTFTNDKTYSAQISIGWASTYVEWDTFWDHYSIYIDDEFVMDTTSSSEIIDLPSVEMLHNVEVVAHDDFGNTESDSISLWLDLDTVSISGTTSNGGDLPSTGHLKLNWVGSADILYYKIKVKGKIVESSYTKTVREFAFSESGTYVIQIIGVDSYSDETVATFTVYYDAPEKVSKSTQVFDTMIMMIALVAAIAIAAVGIALLVVRKDKTIDYSQVKSTKTRMKLKSQLED